MSDTARRPATSAEPSPPTAPRLAEPVDFRAAFLDALKLRAPPERDRQAAAALRRWLEADFDAAFGYVSAMPAGALPLITTPEVARALARRDPMNAIAWTKTITDPHVQRLALHTTLEVWAEKDSTAAARYVAAMEVGPAQMSAAAEVARIRALGNPTSAIAWAQSLSNSSARDFALISISAAWAQHAPAEAAKWASELPAGETRAEALNGALTYWLLNDEAATRKFVGALPVDLQVRAAAFIAPMLAQTNPRTAADWARTLTHAEARDAALAAVFAQWRATAPNDADAWLKTANLPALTKTKLQKGR